MGTSRGDLIGWRLANSSSQKPLLAQLPIQNDQETLKKLSHLSAHPLTANGNVSSPRGPATPGMGHERPSPSQTSRESSVSPPGAPAGPTGQSSEPLARPLGSGNQTLAPSRGPHRLSRDPSAEIQTHGTSQSYRPPSESLGLPTELPRSLDNSQSLPRPSSHHAAPMQPSFSLADSCQSTATAASHNSLSVQATASLGNLSAAAESPATSLAPLAAAARGFLGPMTEAAVSVHDAVASAPLTAAGEPVVPMTEATVGFHDAVTSVPAALPEAASAAAALPADSGRATLMTEPTVGFHDAATSPFAEVGACCITITSDVEAASLIWWFRVHGLQLYKH